MSNDIGQILICGNTLDPFIYTDILARYIFFPISALYVYFTNADILYELTSGTTLSIDTIIFTALITGGILWIIHLVNLYDKRKKY